MENSTESVCIVEHVLVYYRSGKELMDDHSWPLLDPMIGVNTTLTKKVQAIACTVAE